MVSTVPLDGAGNPWFGDDVTQKSYDASARDRLAGDDYWGSWRAFILEVVREDCKKRAADDMRVMAEAIATVLHEAKKNRQTVEAELRAEIAQLRDRIAALEARPALPAIRAVG
jgi:hypothetical protein